MNVYQRRMNLIVWCINIQQRWIKRVTNIRGAEELVKEATVFKEPPYVWWPGPPIPITSNL